VGVFIKEVENKKELKKFILFPFSLYGKNKYWVPPLIYDEMNTLNKSKNPAFEFCDAKYWLAYKDGNIVGRIAGIINNRYIENWHKKYVRFGWVDFINDEEVSVALISVLEQWARENKMEAIHGPLGFTDFDPEGLLVEGFEELGTLGAIYNYPYYIEHIEKRGYKKDIDWIEFKIKPPEQVPVKVNRIAEIVLNKYKLKILKVKKAKELLPYGREIFEVINCTFKDLYGFVQLSEKQIDLYIKQYFGFIRPDYVPVVLDDKGRVAAFGITMPSLSIALQKARGKLFPIGFIRLIKAVKKNDFVDLYLVGVRPDFQDKGVNAILINEMAKVFINNKVKFVETNRELETNYKVQGQWKGLNGTQHKRRRCYIKTL
jgi:ribosomal protein S18 acetylase RimI-like enzyme